jgi:carboxylate-amine ligase
VWRAQRYGTGGTLVDFGKGALVPFPDLIEELIEIIAQDAVEFEVEDEIRRARDIIAEGTSADRQIAAYRGAIESGASEREALQAVVDELIADTLHGIAT